jgi:hypothetical protein
MDIALLWGRLAELEQPDRGKEESASFLKKSLAGREAKNLC